MHDLKTSLRQVRRSTLTACLAVATLEFGNAVASAVHGVVRGVLFGGLPYPDALRES